MSARTNVFKGSIVCSESHRSHERSYDCNIVAGVPKSSILRPLLYTLVIHDMPKLTFTSLTMFADDTIITASSLYPSVAFARTLTHLYALFRYFTHWRIRMNAIKTEIMICTTRTSIPNDLLLAYGTSQIK